jgi:peptidoglycan/xylan/chitin deacetylase (PgdA/CDA1 family)
MSNRARLRAAFNATGFMRLRWNGLRSGLYVFTYHRIGDADTCNYDRGVFSCSETRFREHLALYRDRFEVLNLYALQSIMSTSAPLYERGRPLALITFDDGYADNLTAAMPVLREFGLTAVFFIATAFIGTSELPWWDQIAWAIRHSTVNRISLAGCDEVFDLSSDVLERAVMRILLFVRTNTSMTICDRVAEIQEACRPYVSPSRQEQSQFLSWDQVRQLHQAGMDIGSHTHSHPVLSHLEFSAQRHELLHSKLRLEEELASPVTAVAYPAGRRSGYSPETLRIARSVGYQMGFNFLNTINARSLPDPLDIHRLDVDGNLDAAALRARICFPWL